MRFRFALAFPGLLLLTQAAMFADFTTNTTCGLVVPGGSSPTQSNPSACDVSVGTATSSALMQATYTGPLAGAPSTSVSTSYNADASSYPPISSSLNGPYPTGYATAKATLDMTLYTAGPVGSGLLTFGESIGGSNGSDPDYPNVMSISVGSWTSTCKPVGAGVSCTGNFDASAPAVTVPFTVGVPFIFSESVDVEAYSSTAPFGEVESGSSTGSIGFTITGTNGMPLAIYVAPEPSSFALGGLGFLVTLWCARKRFGRTALRC